MNGVNEKFCTSVGYYLFETLSEAQKFCKTMGISEEWICYDNGKIHLDTMVDIARAQCAILDRMKIEIQNELIKLDKKIEQLEQEEKEAKAKRSFEADFIHKDIVNFCNERRGLVQAQIIMSRIENSLLNPIRKWKYYPFETEIYNYYFDMGKENNNDY